MRPESSADDVRHRLFVDVLWRLQEVGALRKIVLIGSWCKYYYNDWFENPSQRGSSLDFVLLKQIDLALKATPS